MRLAVVVLLGALAGCSFDHGIPVTGSDGSIGGESQIDASGGGSGGGSDATIDARPDATPDAKVCPVTFQPINGGPAGSRYKIHGYDLIIDQSQSFANARTTCVNEGGYLAIPNSGNEVTALLAATPREDNMPWMWIGITDQGTEGTWMTVLSATATFLPWGVGEPDGGTQANCLLLAQTNQMYDSACGTAWAFACECEQ